MNREIRFGTAVLTLLLAVWFTGFTAPWVQAVGHAAEAQTIEFAVEGMTCTSCSFAVKAALKKVDGVEDAKVSFREKNAVVTYDPDRVGPEALAEAVDKTGFHAVLPEAAEK